MAKRSLLGGLYRPGSMEKRESTAAVACPEPKVVDLLVAARPPPSRRGSSTVVEKPPASGCVVLVSSWFDSVVPLFVGREQ